MKRHGWNALNLNPHVVWTAGTDGQVDYLSERWREWTGKRGWESLGLIRCTLMTCRRWLRLGVAQF